jgi:predicted nucleic acid-binding protein
MIILDTSVISALMQQAPVEPVIVWLDRQATESVWVTSVTVFEARYGIGLLPRGRRRSALQSAFDRFLAEFLEWRVLDLDHAAATAAALVAAGRRVAGRTVDMRDTLIAGIAIARRGRLATRNVRDFSDLDVDVVNPWEAARRAEP